MKKLFSKKRLKKINKLLKNPVVKYICGTLVSVAVGARLQKTATPNQDNFYSEQEAQL